MKYWLYFLLSVPMVACGDSGSSGVSVAATSKVSCVNYAGNYLSKSFYVTVVQPSCDQVEVKYFNSGTLTNEEMVSDQVFTKSATVKRLKTSDYTFSYYQSFKMENDRLVFVEMESRFFPIQDQGSFIRETLKKNADGSIGSEVMSITPPNNLVSKSNSLWKKL